jgi:elongation factor 2
MVKPLTFSLDFCLLSLFFVVRYQKKTSQVRNVCLVGNSGHGKSTLRKCLTTQAGLLTDDASSNFSANDTTGTLTSTTTILQHSLKGNDNSSTIDNSFEINLIDTPGHIDLIPHVTAALRIVDGALIVVDCLHDLSSSIQTEAVLRQALTEKIKPILVITKLDQAIVEMKLGKEDLYQVGRHAVCLVLCA